jgi:hypothetical protein
MGSSNKDRSGSEAAKSTKHSSKDKHKSKHKDKSKSPSKASKRSDSRAVKDESSRRRSRSRTSDRASSKRRAQSPPAKKFASSSKRRDSQSPMFVSTSNKTSFLSFSNLISTNILVIQDLDIRGVNRLTQPTPRRTIRAIEAATMLRHEIATTKMMLRLPEAADITLLLHKRHTNDTGVRPPTTVTHHTHRRLRLTTTEDPKETSK